MSSINLKSIDDVIDVLDQIIIHSEKNNDSLGYFAVLYQQVTIKVKHGIETNYFDNGSRMEKLDIAFAQKYIDAYFNHQQNKPVTRAWEEAFLFSEYQWPLVVQHLLIGMNAHINLDLGIAAAEIARNNNISELHDDFYRINKILSSQVDSVQKSLSYIWPPLRKILQKTGKLDNLLLDFSMEVARDGAWEFARHISLFAGKELSYQIKIRDKKIADISGLITKPKWWARMLIWFIRLGEKGTVSEKIRKLKQKLPPAYKER